MRNIIAALLLLISVAAGTGCGKLTPLLAPEPRWTPAVEAPVLVLPEKQDVLAYFNDLQGLSESELDREFNFVKERYASAPDEEGRWRLILLTLLPGQTFTDRDYALELLHGNGQQVDVANEHLPGLGRLLRLLLEDHRELKRRLGEENERAEKLAQQLQELKEIEKILSERDKKRPAAK